MTHWAFLNANSIFKSSLCSEYFQISNIQIWILSEVMTIIVFNTTEMIISINWSQQFGNITIHKPIYSYESHCTNIGNKDDQANNILTLSFLSIHSVQHFWIVFKRVLACGVTVLIFSSIIGVGVLLFTIHVLVIIVTVVHHFRYL